MIPANVNFTLIKYPDSRDPSSSSDHSLHTIVHVKIYITFSRSTHSANNSRNCSFRQVHREKRRASGCDDSTLESDFYRQSNSECKENVQVPAKNAKQAESSSSPVQQESEKRYSRQSSRTKESSGGGGGDATSSGKSAKPSSYSRQSSKSSTCSEDGPGMDRKRSANTSRSNPVNSFFFL